MNDSAPRYRRKLEISGSRHHDSDAADLGLEAWKDRLRGLERRLGEFRTELAAMRPTLDGFLQAGLHQTAAPRPSCTTETRPNGRTAFSAGRAVMISDEPRLKQVSANPHLAWLVQRLKRRVELGEPLAGIVALGDATDAQREAVDGLLGRKHSRGRSLQLHLSVLERVLRNAGLLDALEEQPAFLTTRQPLQMRVGAELESRRVYACEDPVVVATAANRLGARSAPSDCVDDQPKTTARVLLNQIQKSGVEIYYDGDFDWPGLRIVHLIHQRHGAKPWRMDAEDYLAAPPGRRLEGEPFQAPWDERLTPAMIDHLLGDLA